MFRASIVKEYRLLLRDRGSLLSLFALPIIFMVVFGSVFTFGPDPSRRTSEKPTLVWACNPDPAVTMSCRLLQKILGDQLALAPATADAARAQVARNDIDFALIVPDGFTGHNGMSAELVVASNVDAASRAVMEFTVRKLFLQLAIGGGSANELVAITAMPRKQRITSAFQITVPSNGVLCGFFLALTLAISFVTERRSGTWRRLLAAPVPLNRLLVAKLVPYYAVGLIQYLFFFAIGMLVFRMPVAGSLVALALMSMAVVACTVGLGFFIASLGGSEKQVGSVGSICILVMGLLGGCMVPRMFMPPFMQTLGLAVPHGWALDGFTAVIVDGKGVAYVAKPFAVLISMAVALTAIAAYRMRKRAAG